MRFTWFLIVFVIFSSFSTSAQADVWWDYMEVQCDRKKGTFKLQDVRIYDFEVPDIPSRNAQLIKKTQDATYSKSTDNNLLSDKDSNSTLATCNIRTPAQEINFKVERTSIDHGYTQGMCGAANSAEITLFADDVPIAVYPSAKTDCFKGTRIKNHPRVTFSNLQLKICENVQVQNFGAGNLKLGQIGEICRIGSIAGHAARQKQIKKQEQNNTDPKLYPLEAIGLEDYIRQLSATNLQNRKALQDSEGEIAELNTKINSRNLELSNLVSELNAMRRSRDELRTQLENPPTRSFADKLRELFRGD